MAVESRFVSIVLASLIVVVALQQTEAYVAPSYRALVGYYQRFMDENQAVMRNFMDAMEAERRHNEPLTTLAPNAKEAEAASSDVVADEDVAGVLVPRRDVRQLQGQVYGPQFKRMRPCFYSPIQCLMKRAAEQQQKQ